MNFPKIAQNSVNVSENSVNVPGGRLTAGRGSRNMRRMPKLGRLQISIWRLNALMWCVFAGLFFLRALLHADVVTALLLSLFNLTLCLILSTGLIVIYRRLHARPGFLGVKTAAVLIALTLVATLVQSAAAHAFLQATKWYDPNWTLLDLWLLRMMFFWLVYMAWSLLYFWVEAEKAAEEHLARISAAQAA